MTMTTKRPISLEEAKARYVHRYTLDHKPAWAGKPTPNGKRYAPQYASDAEWYANTMFPGEGHLSPRAKHCESTGQTWPRGMWLEPPETPFVVEGVDIEDGSRTELAAFDNSGDARAFLNRYTSREDAGGWSLIEVYDTRGDDPERLWFWERPDAE